jgi:ABC-type molybdenum transport system ATPase subunit/photorepair protein PhrA
MDLTVRFPDGPELPGTDPIVIIGPNGSGKTKLSRGLIAGCNVEFVNALRNTRIQQTLPAMAMDDAQNSFVSQRNSARSNYWDITGEFDYLLTKLIAEHANAAIRYMDAVTSGATLPASTTTWQKITDLWSDMFPGRALKVEDYRPQIHSTVVEEAPVTYSAQTMSDGEKAALYLAARVLSAEPGVVVVDEPETHLHSLLAEGIWDVLEAARTDVRFVYVTHDLAFGMSRRNASFLLASPTAGLRTFALRDSLPGDVAGVLLGTASFSFYAKRIILCEGEDSSFDLDLYSAWFNDRSSVVKPVGSCDMVHRCVSVLDESLVAGLETIGIIDRDFHPEPYLQALPSGMHPLPLHEVESLYCLPVVLSAVCTHLGRAFDEDSYLARLKGAVSEGLSRKVIIERWKRRLEPLLAASVASVHSRDGSIDEIVASLPQLFDINSWNYSPEAILQEERQRVEDALQSSDPLHFLAVLPGKPFIAIAAAECGLDGPTELRQLVNQALTGQHPSLHTLGLHLELALACHLPDRRWTEKSADAASGV